MRRPNLRAFITPLVCCALAMPLPGCTTQSQRIGADDGSDVCRPQRVALDSTGDFFGEDIAKGAAVGAAGGGLVGLLAGRNARSAITGAVAGGVVGAAGGYWAARQKQASDQASLYKSVSSDLDRENASIDRTQLAFNQLVDCRQGEATRIRQSLRSGQVDRSQAEVMMADVRRRSAADLQIAQTINNKIQQRGSEFTFADAQINPGAPATPATPAASSTRSTRTGGRTTRRPAAPSTPAEHVQVATSTNLAKREEFNQSVARAQSNQSAFELS